MSWDERQRALLAAMGLRVWPPRGGMAPAAPDVLREPSAPGPVVEVGPAAAPAPAGAELATAASGSRDVSSLDWSALRATVADCTACELCNSRRHTVFGVGHERAHWMIVGEAPGEHEDRQGEPFVGAAGQLLDNMLRAIGLSRSPTPDGQPERQVFIANVLKCRPPVNRNPLPQEVAQCLPYLQRQIALVQPRLILAMGRFAVQALLDTELAIGRLRGQRHAYQGVPVVVTYHPAYLLRNPADKARAWEDLCFARELAAP